MIMNKLDQHSSEKMAEMFSRLAIAMKAAKPTFEDIQRNMRQAQLAYKKYCEKGFGKS